MENSKGVKYKMVGEVMIDYVWLVMSVLLMINSVFNGVKWFVIRKDYKLSSFLVIITQFIASIVFLIIAL